jgi:hypothetical protein
MEWRLPKSKPVFPFWEGLCPADAKIGVPARQEAEIATRISRMGTDWEKDHGRNQNNIQHSTFIAQNKRFKTCIVGTGRCSKCKT